MECGKDRDGVPNYLMQHTREAFGSDRENLAAIKTKSTRDRAEKDEEAVNRDL
jgi:hypothetical protein